MFVRRHSGRLLDRQAWPPPLTSCVCVGIFLCGVGISDLKRDLVEMMAERGLPAAHTAVMCWVRHYAAEFEKRWARFARLASRSWRVDETYVKIRGEGCRLCRAVDRAGGTAGFRLRAKSDAAAAKAFFRKAVKKPAVRPADDSPGRLCRLSSRGARVKSPRAMQESVSSRRLFAPKRS